MPLPPDELWSRPSVLGAGGRGRSVKRGELTVGRCGSEDAHIFTLAWLSQCLRCRGAVAPG